MSTKMAEDIFMPECMAPNLTLTLLTSDVVRKETWRMTYLRQTEWRLT